MPRTKGAPARRTEVPLPAGAPWPARNEETGEHAVLCGLGAHSERDKSARPTKRRRTDRASEKSDLEVLVIILREEELLAFLELQVVDIGPEGLSGKEIVVRAVQTEHGSSGDLCLTLKLSGGSFADGTSTATLAAPSLSTAKNLVALLEGGILGVAYTSAVTPFPVQGDPSSSPVLYAWNPGASPRRLPRPPLPPSGAPHASAVHTTGGPGWDAGCGSGLSPGGAPAGSVLQDRQASGPNHGEQPEQLLGGGEDWRPAIYLPAAGDPPSSGFSGGGTGDGAVWLATPPTGSGYGYGGGRTQPRDQHHGALRLGVTVAALERLRTGDPADKQKRGWQAPLLDVLAWLLPHNATKGDKADGAGPAAYGQQAGPCPEPSEKGLNPPIGSPVKSAATTPTKRPPACSPSATGTPSSVPAPTPTTAPASPTVAATATPNFDVGWLYGAVKPSGQELQWEGDPPELRPRLRPYQRRAVAWMLRQERPDDGCGSGAAAGPGCSLHPLWRRLHLLPTSAGGTAVLSAVYVNAYSGALASEPFPPPPPVYGGILADEMGLGKTVELLALITANRFVPQPQPQPQLQPPPSAPLRRRRQQQPPAERVDCLCGVRNDDPDDPELEDEDDVLWILCEACNAWMHCACVGVKRPPAGAWVCSRCLRAKAMETVSEPCGATLIVVPPAILQQWFDEIRRHVHPGALRVVVYGGQTQPGPSTLGRLCGGLDGSGAGGGDRGGGRVAQESDILESMVVSAAQLASADVVLTTYDVLKRDCVRQPDLEVQERNLRRQKKYEVVPTPLTRLRWWRVVLDEAQMVESSTAKAAAMALKLDAVHRWCVTGTPISRGLEDLYGLLAFLGARPWSDPHWWSRCVERPVEAGDPAGRRLLLRLLRPEAATTSAAGAATVGGGGCGGGAAAAAVIRASGGGGGGLMWRSAKRDVEGELGLPPQSSHLSRLRLNAVELHFYNRQLQECAAKARAVLPAAVVAAMESGRLYDSTIDADAAGGGSGEEEARLDGAAGELAVADVATGPQATESQGRGPEAAGALAVATAATAAGPSVSRAVPDSMEVVKPATGAAAAAAAAAGTDEKVGGGDQQCHGARQGAERPEEGRGRDPLQELHELQRYRWLKWQEEQHSAVAAKADCSAAAVAAAAAEKDAASGQSAEAAATPAAVMGSNEDVAPHDSASMDLDNGAVTGPAAAADNDEGGGGGGGRRKGAARTTAHSAPAVVSSSLNRPMTANEAHKLLEPLLRLRQACCHPQVGAGGIRAGPQPHGPGGGHRHDVRPMNMLEILEVLKARAKTEAEEVQRRLITALNGLSALMIIQGNVVEAVATYRKSLRLIEEHKPLMSTDPFLQLHTLHNLAQVLASPAAAAASIPRTLRDHTLVEEAAAIRATYLGQHRAKLAAAEAEYRELVAAASPFHGAIGWYLSAIDYLVILGEGDVAAEYIRERLLEGDTYRQRTEKNASSMAHRFNTLLGLKALLNEALDSVEENRAKVIQTLEQLGAKARMEQPPPDFVTQAGRCGRCRFSSLRSPACEHCRLDELFIQWEVRLFALYSRALTAGHTVTAEEAARRAQTAMVRFAGRGGLAEEGAGESEADGALDGEGGESLRRGAANVSGTQTSWRQSEAEMVLRNLVKLLEQHSRGRRDGRVEEILQEGRFHVERLEAQRGLLLAARKVGLAQRCVLYAHDELGQACLRMRLLAEGETTQKHEFNLKLHLEAVPAMNVELSCECEAAAADIQRALGTLRYLSKMYEQGQRQQQRQRQQEELRDKQQQQQQQQQQQEPSSDEEMKAERRQQLAPAPAPAAPAAALPARRAEAGGGEGAGTSVGPSNAAERTAAAAAAAAAAPARPGAEGAEVEPESELCPICHEAIELPAAPCVIFPCGHQLHTGCSEALVAKTVAPRTPYNQKRVNCPTCRTRVHVAEIAFIDARATHELDSANGGSQAGIPEDGPWAGEVSVVVHGSYGTKIEAVVRRIKFVLSQDAAAKMLVFSSWPDLLDLVAAALRENRVPLVVARGRGGMAAALAAFKDHPGDQLEGAEDPAEEEMHEEEGPFPGRLLGQEEEEEGHTNGKVAGLLGEAPGPAGVHVATACEDPPCPDAGRGTVSPHPQAGRSATPLPPLPPPSPTNGGVGAAAGTGGAYGGSSSGQGHIFRPTTAAATRAKTATNSPGRRRPGLASGGSTLVKPRVLLLQLKQGGAGLNLTEAQHVVLVEPQLDPALEAQAVGRVHRIGQGRPTHVHRFVVEHTVEEQVHKLAAARARGMDLATAVPAAARAHGGRGGGANGGGDGTGHLTVRDVALLLDTRWGATASLSAPVGLAAAAGTEAVAITSQ